MSQPEQSDILVLGSGAAGKYLAWHMATPDIVRPCGTPSVTSACTRPAARQDDGVLAASTQSKQDQ